jgi:hypothetical protein
MHSDESTKIARIIRDGSYYSAMNNTKWIELANAFGDGICARIKLITSKNYDRWLVMTIAACDRYMDGPSCGPVPFNEIEWIDIKLGDDNPRELDAMKVIRDRKLPHTDHDGYIRVFGHIAPGATVKYSAESCPRDCLLEPATGPTPPYLRV